MQGSRNAQSDIFSTKEKIAIQGGKTNITKEKQNQKQNKTKRKKTKQNNKKTKQNVECAPKLLFLLLGFGFQSVPQPTVAI